MSVEFAQILFEPAYRKVAAAIGARILGRTLREGERLPSETELARQFGVNRSTVREALRELESRGLVQRRPGSKLMSVSRPHRDAVAAGVSDALLLHDVTVRDLWEALTIFEPPIAQAAARMRTAEDLQRIVAATEAFSAQRARYRAGRACHGGSVPLHRPGHPQPGAAAGAGAPAAAARALAARHDRQGPAGALAHRHRPSPPAGGAAGTR